MNRDPLLEDSEAPPPNPDETDPYVGQVFAERYRITGLLKQGGMSRIYVARHVLIGRRVAVKVLAPALATDKANVRRFLNEARAAGSIGHPNIVESLDMGTTPDGIPFLVLELLDGVTIADEIERAGDLVTGRAAYVASQMASALGAAHAAAIVHRDIKPENVQLTFRAHKPDHVKILDFGISKFSGNKAKLRVETRAGVILGTPEFMAPEQVVGGECDARTDVYAVGVTLYTMLAGESPFGREAFPQVLQVIVSGTPASLLTVRPDIPLELVVVVERAMAKAPADRFQTMAELQEALLPFVVEPEAVRSAPAPGLASLDDGLRRTPSERSSSVRSRSLPEAGGPRTSPGKPSASRAAAVTRAAIPFRRRALGGGLVAAVVAVAVAVAVFWSRRPHRAPPTVAAAGPLVEAPNPGGPPVASASAPAPPALVDLDIRSDTAGATTTIRGKTHALPYKESVRAGSDPELVEVTAPSRQGRRFWLPLDQPRHLFVSLKRGGGIADATPAETGIALGEAPSLSSTPEADTGLRKYSAPPPRPAASLADAPSPAPAVAATVLATATPLASAALSAPPTASVAPVATAAGPPPGTVDARGVSATVHAHAGEVRTCFQNARMFRSDVQGRVTIQALLSGDGSVAAASVASTTANDSRLEGCILAALKSWSFPRPAGAVAGTATYTFNFE